MLNEFIEELKENQDINYKNDIRKEYETETKKKDDGFYNVKLKRLDNEYGKIEEIAGTVYDLGF